MRKTSNSLCQCVNHCHPETELLAIAVLQRMVIYPTLRALLVFLIPGRQGLCCHETFFRGCFSQSDTSCPLVVRLDVSRRESLNQGRWLTLQGD